MKFLTFLAFLLMQAIIASAQVDYSESTIYTPRDLSNLITKTKNKKKSPTPLSSASVAISGTTPIPIDVSVLDAKGAHITNLKKEDFKVFIGDKEAEIKSFTWAASPMNVILLIDTSPSAIIKPQEVQQIASQLIDQFGPEDKIMLAVFNDRLRILTDLTTDRDTLRKAIDKLPTGDGTSLYDSISTLLGDHRLTASANASVILVTDGVDTTSAKRDYASSLLAVEGSYVSVFPIYLDTFSMAGTLPTAPAPGSLQALITAAITRTTAPQGRYQTRDMTRAYEVGILYLNDMVLANGGSAFTVPAFRAKPTEIAKQIHERYFLTVQTSEPLIADQRYAVRVRVDIPNVAVVARGSYIPQ